MVLSKKSNKKNSGKRSMQKTRKGGKKSKMTSKKTGKKGTKKGKGGKKGKKQFRKMSKKNQKKGGMFGRYICNDDPDDRHYTEGATKGTFEKIQRENPNREVDDTPKLKNENYSQKMGYYSYYTKPMISGLAKDDSVDKDGNKYQCFKLTPDEETRYLTPDKYSI